MMKLFMQFKPKLLLVLTETTFWTMHYLLQWSQIT